MPGQKFKPEGERYRLYSDVPDADIESYFVPDGDDVNRDDWIQKGDCNANRSIRMFSVIIREHEEEAEKRWSQHRACEAKMLMHVHQLNNRFDEMATKLAETERRLSEAEQKLADETKRGKKLSKQIKRMQECPVCLEVTVKWSMVMPCGHVFCSDCLSALSKCPTCRGVVSLDKRIFLP